jgi:elongation factor Tu
LDSPFLLPIEKVLNIKGRGTVATGRIERGTVHLNDPVEIVGLRETRPSVVKCIEMFHKLLDQGQAGDTVGISLGNTRKEDLKRGMVIAHPGSVITSEETKVDMYILTHQEGGRHKPFSTGFKPQFFLRTLDITGTLNLPEGHDRAMPGDLIQGATVHLYHPVALEIGLPFAVRHSEQTIGAGMITEVLN